MKFGLFGGAQAVPGEVVTEAALGYHEYGEYIQHAERLGYSSAWLVEHHFTGFSQLSATLNYISYLAGITSKIRLGSAVVVIPWHNPVLLAEQIATIDQLSKGRYDFGIGRGYRANEFHGFGMEIADAQEIFDESVMLLKRSFTETERWSYKSDRWTYNDIIVEPPVVQKPYPPMWIGAASEGSIRGLARNGFNLLLAQVPSFEAIGENVAIYRDELEKIGEEFDPERVAVTRGLMVANNDNERADAHTLRGKFLTEVQALATDPKFQSKAFVPVDRYKKKLDPVEVSENGAILGSSQEMVDRIGKLHELGVRNVLLHDLSGSFDALQQVAEEVMPHFADDGDSAARAAE
ncbi:MAG: LLM class flavin-dependent oxidoreductase [Alphaproteobacteria bacterium]|nr:LLM class flavin-dependent oxidoreductase [Alphaproteobacteria bacterium]